MHKSPTEMRNMRIGQKWYILHLHIFNIYLLHHMGVGGVFVEVYFFKNNVIRCSAFFRFSSVIQKFTELRTA